MINDKNFLMFLANKRKARRERRSKIEKKILTIRNKYILKHAFKKIYQKAEDDAKAEHLRWEYFSLQYKNTTGDKPPFMLKNWFYEPDYL